MDEPYEDALRAAIARHCTCHRLFSALVGPTCAACRMLTDRVTRALLVEYRERRERLHYEEGLDRYEAG